MSLNISWIHTHTLGHGQSPKPFSRLSSSLLQLQDIILARTKPALSLKYLSKLLFLFLGVKMEWCNDGDVLVVGGFVRLPNLECNNELRFYTREGCLRYNLRISQQVIL